MASVGSAMPLLCRRFAALLTSPAEMREMIRSANLRVASSGSSELEAAESADPRPRGHAALASASNCSHSPAMKRWRHDDMCVASREACARLPAGGLVIGGDGFGRGALRRSFGSRRSKRSYQSCVAPSDLAAALHKSSHVNSKIARNAPVCSGGMLCTVRTG